MHELSKAAIIPGCLILSSVALIQWTADNPPFFQPPEAAMVMPAEFMNPISTSVPSSPVNRPTSMPVSTPDPSLTPSSFKLLTEAELRQLDQEALVQYLLDYREQHRFDSNFMADEYRLFQVLLDIEPFAALDYMIAIGHDHRSEFFFSFLYTDFMVHDGQADAVIDYLNRFGPEVSLLNLVAFANMTDRLSVQLQQAVLSEYLAGNTAYHQIIKVAEWELSLTDQDKATAFLNSDPTHTPDPYNLVSDIVALNMPSTYAHLIRYLTEHPDRYRLYLSIRRLDNMDLRFEVDQMMARFETMTFNEQVQSALIALDFGHYDALKFLLNVAKAPVELDRPLNIEYTVLNRISTPAYIDETLAWATDNLDLLVFNPYNRKFEY